MRIKVCSCMTTLLSFLVIGTVYGGIKCNNNCIVSVGEDKSALIACCGAPDLESYAFKIRGNESVNVDFFTYNCGAGAFMQKIKMENDTIISVENLGRGTGSQKCF